MNDGFNLSDQNLVEQFVNDSPRIVYEVKEWGEEIGERFSFYAPSNWDVTGRSMGRALMNGVKKMENVSVFNDIIVTDLLKNGDTVTGALGYDVYSGELIVFEAKANQPERRDAVTGATQDLRVVVNAPLTTSSLVFQLK